MSDSQVAATLAPFRMFFSNFLASCLLTSCRMGNMTRPGWFWSRSMTPTWGPRVTQKGSSLWVALSTSSTEHQVRRIIEDLISCYQVTTIKTVKQMDELVNMSDSAAWHQKWRLKLSSLFHQVKKLMIVLIQTRKNLETNQFPYFLFFSYFILTSFSVCWLEQFGCFYFYLLFSNVYSDYLLS